MAFGTGSNNAVATSGLDGSLLSLFDASYQTGLLVPHYLRTLKNKFGDNGLSDFQLLMGLGMKRGVQNITGWHWEKGLYDAPIVAVAEVTVVPSAGFNIVSDPIAGGNVAPNTPTSGTNNALTFLGNNANGSGPYLDQPSAYTYAKKGQIIMNTSNANLPQYLVTAVSGTTVSIKPILSSTSEIVGAGDIFVVVGSAWDEGTDQPLSSQSFWTKYNWKTQIFKETYQLSGTQKTNAPQWMEVEYGEGKTKKMNGFFYEGQDEAEYRLIKQIALSMIFGTSATNSGVPQTFSGLDNEIASRGYSHSASTNFDVADLRTIANVMSRRYSSNLFLAWLTQELYSSLNSSLNNTAGGNTYQNANLVNATTQSMADVFFGGNMEQTETLFSSFSWQALNVDGYNFALKQARFMQDPATTAANYGNSAPLRKRGWIIPLNKVQDAEGVLRNRIELVYKEMDGYSRFMEITDDGRASARKIGPSDVARLYLSSDLGFDFFTLEQFTRITA
jgi:hypothetical protein